jgi:hypothetical protein
VEETLYPSLLPTVYRDKSQSFFSTIGVEQDARFPHQPLPMIGDIRDREGTISIQSPTLPAHLIATAFLR